MRGTFRRGFTWTRKEFRDGLWAHVGVADDGGARIVCFGPRTRLAFIACEVAVGPAKKLRARIDEYVDPPWRDAVRSGLGGAHAERVRVRQPRPYAFAVRSEDPPAARAAVRNVRRLAAVAARARIPGVGARSIRRGPGGVLLHDPYLHWVVEGLAAGLEARTHRAESRRRVVALGFDSKGGTARLTFQGAGFQESIGERAFRELLGLLSGRRGTEGEGRSTEERLPGGAAGAGARGGAGVRAAPFKPSGGTAPACARRCTWRTASSRAS